MSLSHFSELMFAFHLTFFFKSAAILLCCQRFSAARQVAAASVRYNRRLISEGYRMLLIVETWVFKVQRSYK
jgi:hypothetical protein